MLDDTEANFSTKVHEKNGEETLENKSPMVLKTNKNTKIIIKMLNPPSFD